jgi:transcriptional regulator with XRE-family HTH domain
MASSKRVMDRVEDLRREKSMTQTQVAIACGITQGHYSKVASGEIDAGARTERALLAWLGGQSTAPRRSGRKRQIEALATAILEDCVQLVSLVRTDGGDSASDRATKRSAKGLDR